MDAHEAFTAQADPIWPQVSDRGDYELVTLPGDWSLAPLYDLCRERGVEVLKVRKSHGFWRVRVSKEAPPPGGGAPAEPEAVAA